ncbi:MAG: hypothetical protein CSA49_02375 [Gammaproteobacteria bacterium]|nr:MAG: hypothetical protein CSA49_02375 [Gammaproteobacteria bacterium]
MTIKLRHLLAASASVFAFNITSATASTDKEIQATMRDASESLSVLIPYAYDDARFTATNEQPRIRQHLAKLNTLFAKKTELLGDDSDTTWITLNVIQQHLADTSKFYQAGYYATSQYLLTNIPALCTTCHIQDSAHSAIQGILKRNQFANDFSYGEYLFTIRNYKKSKQFFKSYLTDPDVQQSKLRSLKSLERLLTIELGVNQSISNARKLLSDYQQNLQHLEIKEVTNDWLSGLNAINTEANTYSDLEKMFNEWFSKSPSHSHEFILHESKRPKAIWLRSKFFDLLKTPQHAEDTADTLYMLAVLSRILGPDEPYSFANLYLKQCVTQYPTTRSARHCLQEYKNHLSFYYGGSAGESVPDDLVKEYQKMKKSLESSK